MVTTHSAELTNTHLDAVRLSALNRSANMTAYMIARKI